MISKNSFSKSLIAALKGRMWSVALACILLMFSLPIYGGIAIASFISRMRYDINLPMRVFELYRAQVLGGNNGLLIFSICALATVIAYNGFSYLFSKQKVDLYHAIPVSRTELFVTNYLAGIIAFVVPLVFWMFVTLLIGGAYGMVELASIGFAVESILLCIVGFVLMYSTTIVAIMLTGNVPVSLLATAVFELYGPIVISLIRGSFAIFFASYSPKSESENLLFSTSPILAFINAYFRFTDPYEKSVKYILIIVLMWVVITAIAYVLYRMRASEAAGKSMAFKCTMTPISILLLIPISMAGGLIFISLTDSRAYGWYVFGLFITLIIGHFVVQAVYYFDFKSLFRNLENPAVAGIIVALFSIIVIFDLTGYDKYLPSQNQIESAAVVSYSLHDSIQYYNFDAQPDYTGWRDVWVDSEVYRLDNMKITDKSLIEEFCSKAIEETEEYDNYMWEMEHRESSEYDSEEYVDAYPRVCGVTVKYHLNNGKDVYRKYYFDFDADFDLFEKLYANEEYKRGIYDILDDTKIEAGDDWIVNTPLNSVVLNDALSEQDVKKLLDTYRQELLSQSAESIRNEVPVAQICRNHMFKNDDSSDASSYYCNIGYVYPSFTNTISLLNDVGVDTDAYKDVSNVSYIEVYNWNYDAEEVSEDNARTTYTDEDKIRSIIDVAVPGEYSNVESLFCENENIDVTAKYTDFNPKVSFGNISLSIRKGKCPDFVAKDVNYVPE